MVILLSSDLMSVSRVEGAVKQQGAQLATRADPAQVLELAAEGSAQLVLADLTLSGLNLTEWLPMLRTQVGDRVKVVAYGPHVHEDRLEAARQAGCDGVVSRGELDRKLGELLGRFLVE